MGKRVKRARELSYGADRYPDDPRDDDAPGVREPRAPLPKGPVSGAGVVEEGQCATEGT